jgi:YVTN family beta-propeller protein
MRMHLSSMSAQALGLLHTPVVSQSSSTGESPSAPVTSGFEGVLKRLNALTSNVRTLLKTMACIAFTGLFLAIPLHAQTVTSTFPVGSNPQFVAFSPDGTKAYVLNYNNGGIGSVSVINTANNTVTATIAVDSGPNSMAFTPDGTKAYVVNKADGTISVINTANNTVTATINNVGALPHSIAINPDGSKAYVSIQGSNRVQVIDTSNNTLTTTISVGTGPQMVRFSPSGSQAYVANFNVDSV